MSRRSLFFVTVLLTCHCARKDTSQRLPGQEIGGTDSRARTDGLKSHFGCVDLGEWQKCSENHDRDACKADGCNGNNNQCLPQDGRCAAYASKTACEADAACMYFQAIDDACISACALASSEADCSEIPSCLWYGYWGCAAPADRQCADHETKDACDADPACETTSAICWGANACDLNYTQSACETAPEGCTWEEDYGCYSPCYDVATEDECKAASGCAWCDYYCDEAWVPVCYDLSDENTCKTTDGCIWWPECEPKESCEQLDTDTCNSREGCSTTDWCTSSCFENRTEASCANFAGTTCAWQEVTYQPGPEFRCTTACHKANDHLAQ